MTEQLFDAALGELGVVARGQPCLIVVDFNVPTNIPCLATGISAGLWVDLQSAWALACGVEPAAACKRTWGSPQVGRRRDFMVGCPLAAAAVSSCRVEPERWIVPHLAVGAHFECGRWSCEAIQPVQRTPLWPASWLRSLLWIRVGVPSRWRSKGSGRSMMIDCSS